MLINNFGLTTTFQEKFLNSIRYSKTKKTNHIWLQRDKYINFLVCYRIKYFHQISDEQFLNLFAIEFLEKFGNKNPTQKQIDQAENLLIDCLKGHL